MTEMNKAAAGPLVSVVTPVYNMEPFLGEMLDSVLASDYPQLEVVLVDDGSTDASAAVARAYAARDSRVRLHCQCNGGACRARNKAVELARGELILPVDADNRLEPDFISKAVAVLAARPEVKAVAPGADFSATAAVRGNCLPSPSVCWHGRIFWIPVPFTGAKTGCVPAAIARRSWRVRTGSSGYPCLRTAARWCVCRTSVCTTASATARSG